MGAWPSLGILALLLSLHLAASAQRRTQDPGHAGDPEVSRSCCRRATPGRRELCSASQAVQPLTIT